MNYDCESFVRFFISNLVGSESFYVVRVETNGYFIVNDQVDGSRNPLTDNGCHYLVVIGEEAFDCHKPHGVSWEKYKKDFHSLGCLRFVEGDLSVILC